MYYYVKSLQYPIDIKKTNPKLARDIISQYGGPDGRLNLLQVKVLVHRARNILIRLMTYLNIRD